MSGSVAETHNGTNLKESLRTPVVVQRFWGELQISKAHYVWSFKAETFPASVGKLKRLAAVRGKLAVSGGKLYQVFKNGKGI